MVSSGLKSAAGAGLCFRNLVRCRTDAARPPSYVFASVRARAFSSHHGFVRRASQLSGGGRPGRIGISERSRAGKDFLPMLWWGARSMATDVSQNPKLNNRAFVALGSNEGDRIEMIENACNAMEEQGDIRIVNTSGLWETKPMYVEDQGKFVNGACEVETSLSAMDLLDRLQSVEKELGRRKTIDKGPRSIDLDILLYNDESISNDRLQVPHELMHERDFVLRPLSQLMDLRNLPRSVANNIDSSLLENIISRARPAYPLSTIVPLGPTSLDITPLHPTRATHLMSILNITPDSFSDGGEYSADDLPHLESTVRGHIEAGCRIIDIGGQSSRPNAELVSAEEEISRVLPVISMIRSLPEAAGVCISVDTFHASVARAAVAAGAHMVNDVSSGTMDKKMFTTLAELGCTACLMHMRGTPATMNKLTAYPDGVAETVAAELLERVESAVKAGVRRWRIIVDPGVGFAKTKDQNLELLRRLGELRGFATRDTEGNWSHLGFYGLPWLVGASRKKFIGRITGVKEPRERAWGTAAAVAAAVQGGADIVRVHDVQEMAAVVKMSDAIWRH